MGNPRRVIRRVQTEYRKTFDDHLWPTFLALVLFGGFLCGVIDAYLEFDDPRWYANAWTAIVALPLLIGSLMLLLVIVDARRGLRRPVQFAIVLSIICNVALVLAMDREVFSRLMFRVAQPSSRPRREVVVPEYYRRDAERQPEWLKPLEESASVEPVPEQVLPQRPPREMDQAAKPQTVPVRQTVPTVDPNVLRRRQLNQTQPRRADQPTPLSRRVQAATPQLSRPLPQPAVAAAQEATRMVPAESRMTRREQQSPLQQSDEVQPQSTSAAPDATVRRRAAVDPSGQVMPQPENQGAAVARREPSTRPTTNRAVQTENAQAADVPADQPQPVSLSRQRQAIASERAVAAPRNEPVAVEKVAQNRNVSRRSPQQEQMQIAALPQPREEVRARLTPRPAARTSQNQVAMPERNSKQAARQQPEAVAAAQSATKAPSSSTAVTGTMPQQAVNRTRVETTRVAGRSPARRRVAPPEDGPEAAAAARELERRSSAPSGLNVPTRVAQVNTNQGPQATRQPEPVPTLADRSRRSSPEGASEEAVTVLRGAQDVRSRSVQRNREIERRAVMAADPTIAPVQAAGVPSRALAQSELVRSPVALSRPSASTARESTNTSQTELQASALAPGRIGTAGTGAGPNLDRGQRTGANPAALASGARVRKRPLEEDPRAVALHSAQSAEMPRARGNQPLPQATLAAQPVETAARAGSERPSASASASAASIERSQAEELQGPTVDAGQVEVDLGPTRLVAADRDFRPAGGGQPRQGPANPKLPSAEVSRRRPDLASLDSNVVAERTMAPAAEGGGTPLTAQPDSQALARARRDPGGENTQSATSTTLAGPAVSRQSSAVNVIASLTRSRRDQSRTTGQGPSSQGPATSQDRQESALRIQRQRTAAAPETASVSAPSNAIGQAGTTKAESGPVAAGATMARRAEAEAVPPTGQSRPAETGFSGGGGRLTRRTEQAGATAGPVSVGGGSRSPRRAAVGPRLEQTMATAVEALSASTGSGGESGNAGLQSQSVGGRKTASAVGATAAAVELPARGRESASASAPRRRRVSAGQPVVATANEPTGQSAGSGPRKRATVAALRNGPAGVGEAPEVVARAGTEETAGIVGGGRMLRRRQPENLRVDLDAPSGIGGLGRTSGREAGLPDRRAIVEQQQVQSRTVRFARRELGGLPDFSPTVANAVEPFRRREERRRAMGGDGSSSRGSRTEAVIERGLMFLARHQGADGRWELSGFGETVSISSDTAATGMALLCFTGGAYSHREGKHAETVDRGLKFLVANQRENGDLYIEMEGYNTGASWLYSHSIASIALCEAYGMTQDPALKEPAQRSIDFILAAQHPERGGWRYSPRKGTDTSVTGWMLMALYSARLAGLEVSEDAWPKLHNWLDLAQAGPREPHLYRYNPFAPNTPEQGHGREASTTMTAVGLLMRFYASGWRRDNPHLLRGADHLLKHPPANGTAARPQRDTYYWYYATQVMFHVGGERWQRWWDPLSTMLRTEQIKEGPLAGSWNPRTPVPDRWGPHAGRHYVTALNLLSLEVRWRHLPIYDDYAQQRQGDDAEASSDESNN